MKKIFQVIAMAATASMIAGCVCSKKPDAVSTAQAEVRANIQQEIEAIKQTVEVQPCQFENDTVKKLFREIPFLTQQSLLNSMDIVLEANDGSVQYQIMLQREGFAKVITKKQNKLVSVDILDGRIAYTSKDGIEFTKMPAQRIIMLYTLLLNFQRDAKTVSLAHGKAFHFDGKTNQKIVDEALEVSVIKNNSRSNQLKTRVANRDIDMATIFSCTADAIRLPQQFEIKTAKEQYRISFDRFIALSLKIEGEKNPKDIIQPTALTVQMPEMKKPVAFTVKKFQPNVTFKKDEFKPAIVITPKPAKKAAPAKSK